MSIEDPYESSSVTDPDAPTAEEADKISPGHAAYNVVSDTVTGLNVRKSDNKFQALFVLAAVVLLAAVGAIVTTLFEYWGIPWYGGAMFGAFAGLVVGVFSSGIFLMVYRAIRHVRGKHD